VILLSAHGEVATAVEAMKAGASDFLQKPCGTQTIIDAVHHALAQAEAVNIKEERARSAKESMARLTAKEREVLDAVVAGHSNKVIAIDLGISDKAVENRRARLMHKLGAGSVADLVRMVCEVEVE
jgi:FixJ family two-component response regulator